MGGVLGGGRRWIRVTVRGFSYFRKWVDRKGSDMSPPPLRNLSVKGIGLQVVITKVVFINRLKT